MFFAETEVGHRQVLLRVSPRVIACWWPVGWNRCATLFFAHSPSPPADHGHSESVGIVLGAFRSPGPPPIPPPPDVAGRIVFFKCSCWYVQSVPCDHLERISAARS